MFRGSDPSRPLQIGHVEGVYEINGTTEDKIVLCGHGSGTPSTKNMKTYCTSREASKAPNGKTKGLVCVLRCIKDDNKNTYKIVNCSELNVREKPNSEKTTKIIRTLKAGNVVEIEKITTNESGSKWGKITGKKEYISMKYTEKVYSASRRVLVCRTLRIFFIVSLFTLFSFFVLLSFFSLIFSLFFLLLGKFASFIHLCYTYSTCLLLKWRCEQSGGNN